jgi:hypothetical protein
MANELRGGGHDRGLEGGRSSVVGAKAARLHQGEANGLMREKRVD